MLPKALAAVLIRGPLPEKYFVVELLPLRFSILLLHPSFNPLQLQLPSQLEVLTDLIIDILNGHSEERHGGMATHRLGLAHICNGHMFRR